jgi:hypothetical protein
MRVLRDRTSGQNQLEDKVLGDSQNPKYPKNAIANHRSTCTCSSASARISKGQGYQGFVRKRAWSSFGQKWAICVVQGKTDRISLLSGSIKCFPITFNTFKTLKVAP